jgi:hypothetical protein
MSMDSALTKKNVQEDESTTRLSLQAEVLFIPLDLKFVVNSRLTESYHQNNTFLFYSHILANSAMSKM